ncbi:hypothetical protein [Olleya sp. R77988]|uniref:FEKKY domain-containing protein n=1 Tax=Olleya sp. R77988 TaxID=3093875 RepID=UPI0037CBFE9C
MRNRTKYILLILAIAGFALSYYNHFNALNETSFEPIELTYAKRFFGIGILCAGIYLFKKNWRNILTKFMLGAFGICFAINLFLFIEIYPYVQIGKLYAEYSEIETCGEMEKRFATDLKNEEIVYFQFGIGYDIELVETLKEKYKIQSIGMGCTIQSEKECYNKLVNEYLKEKHNDGIIDY